MVSASRRPAAGFIFVTMVLSVLGFGLLIPVLPELVKELNGGDLAAGSHTYGFLIGCFALLQFIGAPILGALSDRFGRRRVILISIAGSSIDYVMMALAPNLGWFFAARCIAGFTSGVLATANAYIADVTPPEKRAGAFGLLGAAFGIGLVIGPLLGGFLGGYSLRLPFWFAAGCTALNGLYGFFFLPESLAPAHRRPFSWSRANPVGAFRALQRLPAVRGLADAYFLIMLAQAMFHSVWVLYTGHRYAWSTAQVGLSLGLGGLLAALVQATAVRRIVGALGDSRAVLTGFTIMIIAQLWYGLSPVGWMIYVGLVIGSFAGITGPAIQSYVTKQVPPDEQGAVQGVLSGLQSLAGIPGPLISTWSFGWAVSADHPTWLAGTPFFISAGLITLAFVVAFRSFRRNDPAETTA